MLLTFYSVLYSRTTINLTSQNYFTTDGLPPISPSWRRAPWGSRPECFPQLNCCSHSPYITSSLMRGWVCHLQLLLALASSFNLGSEFCGTRDHILLSQIRDFPFCRLLRLAGLRWRYSTPPSHGKLQILLGCYIVFLYCDVTPESRSSPLLDNGSLARVSAPTDTLAKVKVLPRIDTSFRANEY
jgi:hypothetical protein